MAYLPLLRGLHLLALVSGLGTLVFARLNANSHPNGNRSAAFTHDLRVWLHINLGMVLLTALGWGALKSADMGGAQSGAELQEMLPIVLLQTHFGLALMARLVLIALAWLWVALGNHAPGGAAVGIAALGSALMLQAMMGHGAGSDSWLLPALLVLHVLAAALWLGGLAPLALAIHHQPERAGTLLASFSVLGLCCVTTLAMTATAQSWLLIGDWNALVTSQYGRVALLKSVLFAALLAAACFNRFVWMPRLDDPMTLGRLRATLVLESLLGVAMLLVAALLATLPPPLHG